MTKFLTLLIIITVFLPTLSNGQDKKIRVGGHLGFGVLTSKEQQSDNFGVGGSLEGDYMLTKQFALGIEISAVSFANEFSLTYFSSEILTTVLIKARYYLAPGKAIQPFGEIGTGVGILFPGNNSTQSNFQIKPELGIKIFWFNLGLGYHFIGSYEIGNPSLAWNYDFIELTLGISLYFEKK
jgi:outer membrane protein with beta-barrel domain